MPRKRMTYRAAIALRKRVRELESKLTAMHSRVRSPSAWNGGVDIGTQVVCERGDSAVRTAMKLGFGVVVRANDNGSLSAVAIKVEEV